jgi:hypothetical protein
MANAKKDLTRWQIGDILVNTNERNEFYGDLIIVVDFEEDLIYPYKIYSFVDEDYDHISNFVDYKKVENVEEIPYNPKLRQVW